MFGGYFVNNLDFGFKIVEISMVCRGWSEDFLILILVVLGMVRKLKLVGLCTKAGRLTAHGNFLPKMEKDSRNHPL